jgi:hypothetical protein
MLLNMKNKKEKSIGLNMGVSSSKKNNVIYICIDPPEYVIPYCTSIPVVRNIKKIKLRPNKSAILKFKI